MWGKRADPDLLKLSEQLSNSTALTDAIADGVRSSILQGTLYPGEHLCQRTLAAMHATSKVPVREALTQLHSEGLLQHDRNRGYFVLKLSREEARQIYVMRRWLETELLKSLHWPDSQGLDQFVELQSVVCQPQSSDLQSWFNALERLRALLFGLSPEKTLFREAARIWVRTDRLHAYLRPEGPYDYAASLKKRDRQELLERHAAERDEADVALGEAQISMPGLWA